MFKINPSRLRSVLLMIVLIFSLFGPQGQAMAKTVQEAIAYLPTNGNLPGGTPISVAIDTPVDGAVTASGDISVDGTASIGMGVPVANTALVYVLDVSGSALTGNGCGGDQNSDGQANTILDCEILAARTLNVTAQTTGIIADVGVAVFATSGSPADVGPAPGDQLITGPSTDADSNGGGDVEEVLVSVGDGHVKLFTLKIVGSVATNFSDGIQAALDILSVSSKPNKMVVFMSDGQSNLGVNVNTLLPSGGVKFFTFAVGDQSSCTQDPISLGSLQDIADLTGGTCTQVSSANIDALPDILPGIIASKLLLLEQQLDGGIFTPIPNANISLPLPQAGPATVTYSYELSGLAPGEHTICVRATGEDSGGQGTVTDCHTVNVAAVDLLITKSDSPDPVTAGSNLTYSLTVTNNGPGDATGVMVTDTLPTGVTFVPATSSPGCAEAAGVVTCDVGNLVNGASAAVTIDVTIDVATCGSSLTNTAVVEGNEPDPDSSNNTASTDTLPNCLCPILDDFNRPNGQLGSNWAGRTNGYRIVSNQVTVRRGGPIYWQPEAYGSDQEACVTLTRINPNSKQHALLLKVQELNDWRQGAILVSYNARSGNVDVEARDVSNKKWILVSSLTPPAPVVDGDQLRAKAFADGMVEVLINNTSIGTADAGSFYVDKGGQIGLWFRGRQGEDDDDDDKGDHDDRIPLILEKDDDDDDGSPLRAWLDDFGGGTLPAP